ncbi:protein of unknown function [Kyrpidia spormannii]|uniref:Uncharacterized protein n=2 Tax=Kyrpidia spormannii TaxID=2055160 RepID=A0ACA8ZB46_9BACL|nr:protein of unknown function [Kyrpidia spormannii]CAB3394356.1 protein of unknown function [Kyrpidia spormannii]
MVHLHAHSYFSFLNGASAPEELVDIASQLGISAMALTDRDTVAGLVPFHRAAERVGIRPISGAEVTMEDGTVLTVLAENAKGYAELCTLLTKAHLSHPRGEPRTLYQDLVEHREGLIVLSGDRRGRIPSLLLQKQNQKAREMAEWLRDRLGKDRFFLKSKTPSPPVANILQISYVNWPILSTSASPPLTIFITQARINFQFMMCSPVSETKRTWSLPTPSAR